MDGYDVISTRANGDQLIGLSPVFAQDRYAAGTPPVNGLRRSTGLVESIRIGDRLDLQRDGDVWHVSRNGDEVGVLRWRPGDDGRVHAVNGCTVRLPSSGVVIVERLVISPDDDVKDIGGYAVPA